MSPHKTRIAAPHWRGLTIPPPPTLAQITEANAVNSPIAPPPTLNEINEGNAIEAVPEPSSPAATECGALLPSMAEAMNVKIGERDCQGY